MPPRRRKLSLAAALFDFPAAPGRSTPHQHAPESWLELFTSKHANAAVFMGLFRSCRAGRDLVLCRAPQAKARLDCTAAQSLAGWMRQLTAVWAGLRTRGTQAGAERASLTVWLEDTPECAKAAALLLGSLPQAEPNLGSLTLEWERPDVPYEEIASVLDDDFLQVRFTYSLQLSRTAAHRGLARFVELTAGPEIKVVDDLCSSIALYLPQIRSLHLASCDPDVDYFDTPADEWYIGFQIPWQIVFQPEQVTHTLTTLSTNATLSDELVQLILDHAPALRDLTAGGEGLVVEQDWAGQGREWRVQRLGFKELYTDVGIDAMSLALLPVTKQGHVLVEGERHSSLLLPHAVKIDKIRYNEAPDSEPADADPPEQLCRMLRMLSLLVQPSSGTVEFMGMRFTMRPLQFLAETLPGLGELTFSIELDEPLTDELLGAVLGVGTRVERLTCPSVALQSDQHANTPWPWEFLTCTTLDVGQVCRLPDPAGAKSIIGCIIQVEELVIGPEPDEVGAATRLPHIRFKSPLSTQSAYRITLQGSETHTCNHQSQVLLLKHIRWWLQLGSFTVSLVGWKMTQKVYKALEGLPDWHKNTLDMSQCAAWPLTAARNADMLLKHVPVFYTCWRLPDTQLHRKVQGLIKGTKGKRRRKVTVVVE